MTTTESILAMLERRADLAEQDFDRAREAVMRLHAQKADPAAIREAVVAQGQARARAMELSDCVNSARAMAH